MAYTLKREQRPPRTIESIRGLKSSLAALKTDASAARTYCLDAAEASEDAILHAGISVAEAENIRALAKKFRNLSGTFEVLDFEAAQFLARLDERVTAAAAAQSAAELARRAAEASAAVADAVSRDLAEGLDSVKVEAARVQALSSQILNNTARLERAAARAEDAAANTSAARDAAEAAMARAESASTQAESNARKILSELSEAHAARDAAMTYANTTRGYRDAVFSVIGEMSQAQRTLEAIKAEISPALHALDEAAAVYREEHGFISDALERAERAAASSESAEIAATLAADAAAAVRVAVEGAVSTVTAAEASSLDAAARAEAAAASLVGRLDLLDSIVEGNDNLRMVGEVSRASELPAVGAMIWDAYLVGAHGLYDVYIWNGSAWAKISGRGLSGGFSETAGTLESAFANLENGAYVTVFSK